MELTDGVITLVRNETISENPDLTKSRGECFEIKVNSTGDFVGIIGYTYAGFEKISYDGNINYRIDKEHRGNGYAKRALTLLLNILKYNTEYDEKMYVSSVKENSNYLNVARECGGKLIHSGKVPEKLGSWIFDTEMKYVDVYEFEIEKIKENIK